MCLSVSGCLLPVEGPVRSLCSDRAQTFFPRAKDMSKTQRYDEKLTEWDQMILQLSIYEIHLLLIISYTAHTLALGEQNAVHTSTRVADFEMIKIQLTYVILIGWCYLEKKRLAFRISRKDNFYCSVFTTNGINKESHKLNIFSS